MYQQTDGIAMGSPFDSVLANSFVGCHEALLYDSTFLHGPKVVDGTFVILKTNSDSEICYNKLNSLHPSLKFTVEKETDVILPFLDVKIKKDTNKFLTSVYRKLTFMGKFRKWLKP